MTQDHEHEFKQRPKGLIMALDLEQLNAFQKNGVGEWGEGKGAMGKAGGSSAPHLPQILHPLYLMLILHHLLGQFLLLILPLGMMAWNTKIQKMFKNNSVKTQV